ncbi:MAG TPA: caspase family protein [Xanthobacteraceae bacterium]|nr:caspase family protein [Xanthobacteraceae bacterium]
MHRVIKYVFVLFGFILAASSLSAAPREKRIALVIGNAAYQQGALPTTANDAGLIAQTLQAAGFDVMGARDLDGDTLRHTLRDFIEKAVASGPDTVAMVYLAGYGLQMSGENFFAPVDAKIVRDTDLPVEALRVSDYIRQLGTLPLRAGIFVLDGAHAPPFSPSGQPLAGGLALVEPDPNMLVAFNAAPGTIGPNEPGPYGAYAQALAEMIRQGGLSLPELFNRVRLRVNEITKGAEVPWNAQHIQTDFMFFERAPDAPQAAPPAQVAEMESRPIRDFDARDAYIAALDRDTLQAYEEFLAAFPDDPLAKRVRAIVAARREAITWRRSYRADTADAYWSYLRRYPNGPHAWDARRRLATLAAALEPPPVFAVMNYDVPPPPPDEILYVERPVILFDDPVFAFAPPPSPPVFFLPPPEPDFVVLPPPPPPVAVFVLPVPMFVAMPSYVRPPAYVAPPPNNIIFANIHNATVINNVINQSVGSNAVTPAPSPSAATASVAPILPAAVAQKATLMKQQDPKATSTTGQTPFVPGQVRQANRPGAGSQQTGLPPAKLQPLPGAGPQPLPKSNAAPGAPGPAPANRLGVSPGSTPGHSSATVAPAPQGVPPRPGVPAAALPPPSDAVPSGPTVHPPGAPARNNTTTAVSPQIANRPPPPSPNINRPAPPPPVANHPPSPPVAVNRSPPAPVVNHPSPPPSAAARPAPQTAKKCVVQNGKQVCE